MKMLSVLNVEDSQDDSDLLLLHLKKAGYQLHLERVETAGTMRFALQERSWDIIISDYRMPNFSGMEAFAVLRESKLDIPFIIISGTIGEETAVKAMLAGVSDYMMKGNLSRLVPAIERELNEFTNRRARRDAEEALRESERRLMLALAAARMGVWEWDLQSGELVWSDETYDILGFDKTFNATIDEFSKYLAPDQQTILNERTEAALKQGPAFEAELQVQRPDGKLIWISNHGKVDLDENGDPRRIVCIVLDVTEKKNAENELRQSEQRFRSLVTSVSQIVWMTDASGRLIGAYMPEDSGLGLSQDDLFADWVARLHPDDRERA
jgi:PAS domain S-box-containing protein